MRFALNLQSPLVAAAVAAFLLSAGPVLGQTSGRPAAGSTYVFYLHGRGEEEGRSAARFGPFQFNQIVASLQKPGRTVIASRRRPGNIDGHASQLAGQVQRLLGAGVSPRRIGIVGFSRGGHIALLASAQLRNPAISYVILAGCTNSGFQRRISNRPYATSGRTLSLIDQKDELSSPCRPSLTRHQGSLTENVLRTNRGHGLFYSADRAWLGPTLSWLP